MDIFKSAINDIESKSNLKNFIDGLPQFIDLCTVVSKAEKAYYGELIKEGFTEEQALRLVMAHGLFPGRTDRSHGSEDK